LTTLHRGGTKPFDHPQLGVTLQPLKFMEFSLVNVQQAVLIANDKAVLVNLPHPARYALHKLLVYGERTGTFAAKSSKDLMQSASLLSVLSERRRWEVDEAWADLIGRGKGWRDRAKQGRDALDRVLPELDVKQWLKL
jgi:hypothetical protein